MKLSSKIIYCRKKAGLSQEALADVIGVSRQAVSKWETEDAAPEISKLLLLAKAFHVTTDWLLSEDEPEQGRAPSEDGKGCSQEATRQSASGVDAIPGVIGKLIRRYGWLCGVYIALSGLGFTVIGTLARVLTRQMLPEDFFDMGNGFSANPITNNPVVVMGTVIMVIGIVLMIAGVILALYLKRRADDDKK